MGCCPNNVNPIPPTQPPVPPVEPPVPPDYEYPTAFNKDTDLMILATESNIKAIEGGTFSNEVLSLVPPNGTTWYELEIPSYYAGEYYLSFTTVDHAVPGSGDGTTSAYHAWEQGNIELYRSSTPRYEASSSADTDGTQQADATVAKGSKIYFKVINDTAVQTGYKLDWLIAAY